MANALSADRRRGEYFNDSTGTGDEGETDAQGPWNRGDGLELVQAPAQAVAAATQEEVLKEIDHLRAGRNFADLQGAFAQAFQRRHKRLHMRDFTGHQELDGVLRSGIITQLDQADAPSVGQNRIGERFQGGYSVVESLANRDVWLDGCCHIFAVRERDENNQSGLLVYDADRDVVWVCRLIPSELVASATRRQRKNVTILKSPPGGP